MSLKSKYAKVTYDRATGKIEGETNMGLGDNMYLFSASANLLSVKLAMELEPMSILKFMEMSDGFGGPMDEYDWSGIRDSSPMSKTLMSEYAQVVLAPHTKHLAAMGLPAALVADLTGAVVNDEPVGMFDEVKVTPKRKRKN